MKKILESREQAKILAKDDEVEWTSDDWSDDE